MWRKGLVEKAEGHQVMAANLVWSVWIGHGVERRAGERTVEVEVGFEVHPCVSSEQKFVKATGKRINVSWIATDSRCPVATSHVTFTSSLGIWAARQLALTRLRALTLAVTG